MVNNIVKRRIFNKCLTGDLTVVIAAKVRALVFDRVTDVKRNRIKGAIKKTEEE